jgi:hypothetical protein
MPDTKYEKSVTIVGYAHDDDNSLPVNKWAEKVSGVGCTSTEKETNYEFTFEVQVEGRSLPKRLRKKPLMESDAEACRVLMDELEDSELVECEDNSRTSHVPINSPSVAATRFKKYIFHILQGELSHGLERRNHRQEWKTDPENPIVKSVRLKSSDFKSMRVLSKEEKREDDDLYETLGERPCFSVEVEMEGHSEEELDDWTNEVVTEVVKLLSKHPEIGKTRFMDCTTETVQEGECYNI